METVMLLRRPSGVTRVAAAGALLVASGALGILQRPADASARSWAPASSAKIHPGVQTVTGNNQCTANFVFTDRRGEVYIGQAAHCSGTSGNDETNGCIAKSMPLGTPVEVDGASAPGTMVYNSWLTMQAAAESGDAVCNGNDFALIKLDRSDIASVNPSVPTWGGPVGINTQGTGAGDVVYAYGRSGLWFGLPLTSDKQGYSLGDSYDGWSHTVYTVTPGIPGDSGSAYLDGDGRALGVLSTIEIYPLAARNWVSNLNRALAYMRSHVRGFASVQLALGTEPFSG